MTPVVTECACVCLGALKYLSPSEVYRARKRSSMCRVPTIPLQLTYQPFLRYFLLEANFTVEGNVHIWYNTENFQKWLLNDASTVKMYRRHQIHTYHRHEGTCIFITVPQHALPVGMAYLRSPYSRMSISLPIEQFVNTYHCHPWSSNVLWELMVLTMVYEVW